jgi:hypothetical protein
MKAITLMFFFTLLFTFLFNGCSQQHKTKPDIHNVSPKTVSYLATYSIPCGQSVLTLEMGDKKSQSVSVIGEHNPIHELNEFVLSNTKLQVSGYFNGKNDSNQHCSSYPEFVVTGYKAAGGVSRCTTYSDIYNNEFLILFPQELPKSELAPMDYKKNLSLLKTTSLKNCREISKNDQCTSNETLANSCDLQEFWCCINYDR